MVKSFKQFILDNIYPRLLIFGHYSGCHQMEERSFFIGIRQFPVCARCTGIICGAILSPLILLLQLPIPLMIVISIPLIIDGTVQLLTKYKSNNLRRLITGILFGFALNGLFLILLRFLWFRLFC